MTTQTIARDCTRTDSYELPRLHREGQWVCRRCLAVLRDSLEIAVHIGRMRSLNTAASRCAYGALSVAFECEEHKCWEEA